MAYSKELLALKRAGLLRKRELYDTNLIDFASNDYLGLAHKKKRLKGAIELLKPFEHFAPKASLLINGYHPLHNIFETKLAEANGFDSGIVVGSGFLANLSLIEALVRKNDYLFIDEEYHASGILASSLIDKTRVKFFRHNDANMLRELLKSSRAKRSIVATEGVYSMSGELLNRDIFSVVDEFEALLIVDEAHSSGVLGDNLLGIFEYYNLPPKPWYIKMGTLGKAYGSYGAYILANRVIVNFLENRAKPIIYSTAPSVLDIALALENFNYIQSHSQKLAKRLKKRRQIASKIVNKELKSQILTISVNSNSQAINLREYLISKGYLVGAIREPTVKSPILRIIPRLGASVKDLKSMLNTLLRALEG